ncbi:hypothetical protein [Glycomyces endophyticus]
MGQAGMLFAFGFLLLVTAIIVVSIITLAGASKAKASAAREANYRELAEKATLDAAEIKSSLIEIKSRLASVEQVLKTID